MFCAIKSKGLKFWILAVFLAQVAFADTYRVNPKVSSAAQDIFYLVEKLEEVLVPSGLILDRESIDIEEKVSLGHSGLLMILETPDYAARSVFFSARSGGDGKLYRGSIYLIIARADSAGKPLVPVNSSVRALRSRAWGVPLYLSLAVDVLPKAFPLDVRPSDFNLHEERYRSAAVPGLR